MPFNPRSLFTVLQYSWSVSLAKETFNALVPMVCCRVGSIIGIRLESTSTLIPLAGHAEQFIECCSCKESLILFSVLLHKPIVHSPL
jgi:hypothetical protein